MVALAKEIPEFNTDGKDSFLYYDLERIANAVDANATVPFVGHQWEDQKQGDLTIGRKLVETGVIYDTRVLKKLKVKALFALWGEMAMVGGQDLAEHVIFDPKINE